MAKLFFIRHAESIANTKGIYQGQSYDTALSYLGKKQAECLAKRLVEEKLDKVVTSHLKRAKQTAEIIAQYSNAPLLIDINLRETNHGDWEGLSREKIKEKYPENYHIWRTKPLSAVFPNGEAFKETVYRVEKWLERFTNNITKLNGNTAIVSHDNILRIIFCKLMGLSLNKMWELKLEPAAISLVEYSQLKIVTLNDNIHLKHLVKNTRNHAL